MPTLRTVWRLTATVLAKGREMRLDLRYLPFRLPATLGRCRHWYDPQNGKVLLYVQHPTSIDPQNDETVADCISWVVEQFDIKHLAFDG